jgi:hypothetical protein
MYDIPLVYLKLTPVLVIKLTLLLALKVTLVLTILLAILLADMLYASVRDHWVRYAAERAASIAMLLVLATVAAIYKMRAYRVLLGAALLAANLALILALISRWFRPASRAWGLFSCCAITVATTIVIAAMSAHGSFPVNE